MSRDLLVKVLLSAEEFIAFRAIADEQGESQSGFARRLIKQEIRRYAQSETDAAHQSSTEAVHEVDK